MKMNVFVNSELKEITGETSLNGLLQRLELTSTSGVALAVNNKVIARNEWEKHLLKENDRIVVIHAAQGG